MRRNILSYMALVGTFTLAACGETDPVMDQLTEAEASDLAGTVMLATFDATEGGQPAMAPGGPQLAPFEYTASLDTEVECPLGGTVEVMADVVVNGNTESQAGTLEYSMTQVHHECGVVSENDRQFTLWGAPSLTLDLLVGSNGQGVVEWEGSVTGVVEWATDAREGRCEVNLEFSARREGDVAFEAELTGAACGFEVTRTLTVGGEGSL